MDKLNFSIRCLSAIVSLVIIFLVICQPGQSAPFFFGNLRSPREKGCYYLLKHYKNGEQIETNEPCLNCTCSNSMLMCYLRVCPFLRPLDENCTVNKIPGQCCPEIICPDVADPEPELELSFDPETFPESVSKTKLEKTTIFPTTELQYGQGCYINNNYYLEGAMLPIDLYKSCEICYCIRNSSACTIQECALQVSGCFPVFVPGQCCPARYNCTSTAATTAPPNITDSNKEVLGCSANGKFYLDGEQVNSTNPCEHCYCMRNEVVCAVQKCIAPCEGCVPIYDDNTQCCPKRYECYAPTTTSKPYRFTTSLDTKFKESKFLITTQLADNETSTSMPLLFETIQDVNKKLFSTTTIPVSNLTERKNISKPVISCNKDKNGHLHLECAQNTSRKAIENFEVETLATEAYIGYETQTSTNVKITSTTSKLTNFTTTTLPFLQNSTIIFDDTTKTEDEHFDQNLKIPSTKKKPVYSDIPGQGVCKYEGKIYQNKEEIKNDNPCFKTCLCINSLIFCDQVICAPQPKAKPGTKCDVVNMSNKCCPTYICYPFANATSTVIKDLPLTTEAVTSVFPELDVKPDNSYKRPQSFTSTESSQTTLIYDKLSQKKSPNSLLQELTTSNFLTSTLAPTIIILKDELKSSTESKTNEHFSTTQSFFNTAKKDDYEFTDLANTMFEELEITSSTNETTKNKQTNTSFDEFNMKLTTEGLVTNTKMPDKFKKILLFSHDDETNYTTPQNLITETIEPKTSAKPLAEPTGTFLTTSVDQLQAFETEQSVITVSPKIKITTRFTEKPIEQEDLTIEYDSVENFTEYPTPNFEDIFENQTLRPQKKIKISETTTEASTTMKVPKEMYFTTILPANFTKKTLKPQNLTIKKVTDDLILKISTSLIDENIYTTTDSDFTTNTKIKLSQTTKSSLEKYSDTTEHEFDKETEHSTVSILTETEIMTPKSDWKPLNMMTETFLTTSDDHLLANKTEPDIPIDYKTTLNTIEQDYAKTENVTTMILPNATQFAENENFFVFTEKYTNKKPSISGTTPKFDEKVSKFYDETVEPFTEFTQYSTEPTKQLDLLTDIKPSFTNFSQKITTKLPVSEITTDSVSELIPTQKEFTGTSILKNLKEKTKNCTFIPTASTKILEPAIVLYDGETITTEIIELKNLSTKVFDNKTKFQPDVKFAETPTTEASTLQNTETVHLTVKEFTNDITSAITTSSPKYLDEKIAKKPLKFENKMFIDDYTTTLSPINLDFDNESKLTTKSFIILNETFPTTFYSSTTKIFLTDESKDQDDLLRGIIQVPQETITKISIEEEKTPFVTFNMVPTNSSSTIEPLSTLEHLLETATFITHNEKLFDQVSYANEHVTPKFSDEFTTQTQTTVKISDEISFKDLTFNLSIKNESMDLPEISTKEKTIEKSFNNTNLHDCSSEITKNVTCLTIDSDDTKKKVLQQENDETETGDVYITSESITLPPRNWTTVELKIETSSIKEDDLDLQKNKFFVTQNQQKSNTGTSQKSKWESVELTTEKKPTSFDKLLNNQFTTKQTDLKHTTPTFLKEKETFTTEFLSQEPTITSNYEDLTKSTEKTLHPKVKWKPVKIKIDDKSVTLPSTEISDIIITTKDKLEVERFSLPSLENESLSEETSITKQQFLETTYPYSEKSETESLLTSKFGETQTVTSAPKSLFVKILSPELSTETVVMTESTDSTPFSTKYLRSSTLSDNFEILKLSSDNDKTSQFPSLKKATKKLKETTTETVVESSTLFNQFTETPYSDEIKSNTFQIENTEQVNVKFETSTTYFFEEISEISSKTPEVQQTLGVDKENVTTFNNLEKGFFSQKHTSNLSNQNLVTDSQFILLKDNESTLKQTTDLNLSNDFDSAITISTFFTIPTDTLAPSTIKESFSTEKTTESVLKNQSPSETSTISTENYENLMITEDLVEKNVFSTFTFSNKDLLKSNFETSKNLPATTSIEDKILLNKTVTSKPQTTFFKDDEVQSLETTTMYNENNLNTSIQQNQTINLKDFEFIEVTTPEENLTNVENETIFTTLSLTSPKFSKRIDELTKIEEINQTSTTSDDNLSLKVTLIPDLINSTSSNLFDKIWTVIKPITKLENEIQNETVKGLDDDDISNTKTTPKWIENETDSTFIQKNEKANFSLTIFPDNDLLVETDDQEVTSESYKVTSSPMEVQNETTSKSCSVDVKFQDHDKQHDEKNKECFFEGRVYQFAKQVHRKNACEFCFCYRSEIICLQQTCPPPVPNCIATIIEGFCCPRYQCPVNISKINLTTTTTTTTTTNPLLLTKEITGCLVNGKFFQLGELVKPSSGPCIECRCEEKGFMNCYPKSCQLEKPLLLKKNQKFFSAKYN